MTTVDPARLVNAHTAAIGFYRHHLLADDTARLYLARRGLAALALRDLPWHPSVDKPWRIGYAPNAWTTLTDHLTRLGFTTAELLAAGLTRQSASGRVYDTFRNRIMFPIRTGDARPVGFTGRALQPDERTPKYLNTSDTTIFHKGQTWYGLAEQADRLDAGGTPVIVEGPLDVIAVWLAHPPDAGLPRIAVAACGTNLSPDHIAQLTALPGAIRHGITTAYDPDPAGVAATERAWTLLHTHRHIALHAAVLPDNADPADLLNHTDGIAALREGLTHRRRPLVEAVIDHRLHQFFQRHAELPDSRELRVAAVHTVVELLTHVPAEQSRRVLEHVADLTGTSVDAVAAAVIAAFDREHDDNAIPAPHLTAQPPPRRPPAALPFRPPDTSHPPPAGRAGHAVNPATLRRHRPGRR